MADRDEIVQEFLLESHENLDRLDRDLVRLEAEPGSKELLAGVFRAVHTLKGTSGFLGLTRLEAVTHVGEGLLAMVRDGDLDMTRETTDLLLRMVDTARRLLASVEADGTEGAVAIDDLVARLGAARLRAARDGGLAECARPVRGGDTAPGAAHSWVRVDSVRVDVDLLDSLARLAGELALTSDLVARQAAARRDPDLERVSRRLDGVTSELQQVVVATRMQPIDHLWSMLPRVVRDLGAQCGRRVRLEMTGGETELDRALLEAVRDPLTHLVRNAVDHGIEPPEERVAAGKPVEGVVTLRAFREAGEVVVEVGDDGRGIEAEAVAAHVRCLGLRPVEELAAMTDREILRLVLLPGFSTAASVTTVSGRGVGMDVVRANVEGVGGAVELDSVAGKGTTCRLRVPLTPAGVPAGAARR